MHNRVIHALADLEHYMSTVDDALALPRESGEFVHTLVLARSVKLAIEIGTSYGYSGLWIASALAETGGRLVTIDHDPRKTQSARGNFEAAGLGDLVELRTGKAEQILPSVEGPIDFVLNDADKENCRLYVEMLTDKLSDRAVVLTDNTVSHADQLADFLVWIRGCPDFHSAAVPIGSGMELSVKLGRFQSACANV